MSISYKSGNNGAQHASGSNRVSIEIYAQDVCIKRKRGGTQVKSVRRQPTPRKAITCLSDKSRRALTFKARNIEGVTHMLTLTYPAEFPLDGKTVKAHWTKIRKWLTAKKIGGLWVLEFQKRGAPHLHVFTKGAVSPDELSQKWFDIVGSGDARHFQAGTKVEKLKCPHAVSNYATKFSVQKFVPVEFVGVGRLWGTFGDAKVKPVVVVIDTIEKLASTIRTCRLLEMAKRRAAGFKPRRDNGRYSRIVYGVAKALLPSLDKLLPSCVPRPSAGQPALC